MADETTDRQEQRGLSSPRASERSGMAGAVAAVPVDVWAAIGSMPLASLDAFTQATGLSNERCSKPDRSGSNGSRQSLRVSSRVTVRS